MVITDAGPHRLGWDENGEFTPRPMDDPELVDRRRAGLGDRKSVV